MDTNKISDKQMERYALAWVNGSMTISDVMRKVYGKNGSPHIYSRIARALKRHIIKQNHNA